MGEKDQRFLCEAMAAADAVFVTAGRLGAYWAAASLPLPQSVPPRWSELGLGDPGGDWAARLGDPAGCTV